MSKAENPFNGLDLRYGLYIVILLGITRILTSIEMLHEHEAFLVSGALALLACLLLEPRKEKLDKGLTMATLVLSFYGLVMKLPMILMGTLNYYVVYLIAFTLVALVNLGIFVISRKIRVAT